MKRRLLRISVFLLLGAIVNVAVAWGCACWPPAKQRMFDAALDPQEDQWTYCSFATLDSRAGFQRLTLGGAFVYHDSRTGGELPHWVPRAVRAEWGTPEWRSDPAVDDCIWIAEGWPALALRCEMQGDAIRSGKSLMYSGEQLNAPMPGYSSSSHEWIIAFEPLWPGFAINTVFYAFILWLLFAAPFVLRRLRGGRRIRRGLCPKCAYDLRGTPPATACPECGAALGLGLTLASVGHSSSAYDC